MNVLSKEAFAEVVKYKTCDVIVHPWAKTCTDGILKLIWSSLLGSSKFCIALAAALETILAISGQSQIFKNTLFFMVINSLFMYYLRLSKTNKNDHVTPELWFFSPSHSPLNEENEKIVEKRRRPCSHIQSCIKSILKETSKYFWYGAALEALRITVANFEMFIKNPKTIRTSLFQKSLLKLAAFAGLYVFLHKITICALCRLRGKNMNSNTLIAGFISGLSYYVRPNLSISITVFVNLLHLIWKYHRINEKFMRNLPTSELMFIFISGFLFHCRVFAPEYSSNFFNHLINFCTNGRADELYISFLQLFELPLIWILQNYTKSPKIIVIEA